MMEANMRICTDTSRLVLAAGQIATLNNAQGTRIECLSGWLWITQERDERDIMLDPGEEVTLDREGKAVIQSPRQSVVLVSESHAAAQPGRRWRRMAHALLGHFMELNMCRSAWRRAYRI
jgi:Protein of unknown function (DUF2917)